MAKNHRLKYNPIFAALRAALVNTSTLKGLQTLITECKSVFVALDAECRTSAGNSRSYTTEVGMAILTPESVMGVNRTESGTSLLRDFAPQHSVDAYSFKVQGRYGPVRKHASQNQRREAFSFGKDMFILPEDLEAAVQNVLNQCRDRYPGRGLVLVGFSLPSVDFQAMYWDFPLAAEQFATCLDIHQVFKVAVGVNPVPGLRAPLRTLGYKDIGLEENDHRGYHNAGNDAVRTLALLRGVFENADDPLKLGLAYQAYPLREMPGRNAEEEEAKRQQRSHFKSLMESHREEESYQGLEELLTVEHSHDISSSPPFHPQSQPIVTSITQQRSDGTG